MSSAPLRISLAGGGTDVPSYADRFGGAVLGAAISLRVTVVGRPRAAAAGIRACLDSHGTGFSHDHAANPFVAEALRRHWDGGPLDLVSFGDTPTGSGLGSSAAFSLALVAGLHPGRLPPAELARAGSDLETRGLGRPVGGQDHYLSALGGFHLLRFHPGGRVEAEEVPVSAGFTRRLGADLLLFFTGTTRDAGTVLAAQDHRTRSGDAATEGGLHGIKELVPLAVRALRAEDSPAVGEVLFRHWELKRALSPRISSAPIDRAYADALAAGATGGKLMGAGGGGFLLLHAGPGARTAVRAAMRAHGFREYDFAFSPRGVEVTSVPSPAPAG
ncbi:hypothetical protein ACFVT9_12455 [Kitasatospora cineracea]|uniref:GHMP family kinase ATP-binding protein n=1 Tax=Kitasatospora cineracea TaxID=88074 RepID=UPI0033F4E3E4